MPVCGVNGREAPALLLDQELVQWSEASYQTCMVKAGGLIHTRCKTVMSAAKFCNKQQQFDVQL